MRRLPVIEAVGLEHRYGSVASILGVNFQVGEGETVCLLGPSGCGKTTTLRLIAGLENPTAGSIRVDGVEVSRAGWAEPPERRPFGMLFQDYALFPHLTVERNVDFGLRRLPAAERARRVADGLRLVGAEELRGRFPHTLSGGQQQRIALARAMALEPRCLLLDEPFSGLDASLRYAVREETRQILGRKGIASIIVTHDAEEAMHLSERILLMRKGQIEQDGSPEALYFDPKTPFVARFFGDVERFVGLATGDGRIQSPFGPLVREGFRHSGPVEILVRRQGFRLGTVSDLKDSEGGSTFEVEVEESKLIGGRRESRCRLRSREAIRFRALHRATSQMRPGEVVPCRMDPRMVFVFPIQPGATETGQIQLLKGLPSSG